MTKRWPADPAVAEWLNQFRDDEAGRQLFLKRYADERASALVDGKTFWDMARKVGADQFRACHDEAGEQPEKYPLRRCRIMPYPYLQRASGGSWRASRPILSIKSPFFPQEYEQALRQ